MEKEKFGTIKLVRTPACLLLQSPSSFPTFSPATITPTTGTAQVKKYLHAQEVMREYGLLPCYVGVFFIVMIPVLCFFIPAKHRAHTHGYTVFRTVQQNDFCIKSILSGPPFHNLKTRRATLPALHLWHYLLNAASGLVILPDTTPKSVNLPPARQCPPWTSIQSLRHWWLWHGWAAMYGRFSG